MNSEVVWLHWPLGAAMMAQAPPPLAFDPRPIASIPQVLPKLCADEKRWVSVPMCAKQDHNSGQCWQSWSSASVCASADLLSHWSPSIQSQAPDPENLAVWVQFKNKVKMNKWNKKEKNVSAGLFYTHPHTDPVKTLKIRSRKHEAKQNWITNMFHQLQVWNDDDVGLHVLR